VSGSSMFPEKDKLYYILAFLSSNVAFLFLSILAPTVNFQIGNIGDLPIIFDENLKPTINSLAKKNISISKKDWDDYERSWDFKTPTLLQYENHQGLISNAFNLFSYEKKINFEELKKNEEIINENFIKIYNLYNFSPIVNDDDISINRIDIDIDVQNFISYFVGCLFGRYSLDEEGLIYAGGNWDLNKYSKFIPDEDNIVPILDSEYFDDDIINTFVKFLKITFGEPKLEENLSFIAKNLKSKGKTNLEVIRNYFLNDFFKNHVKMYKKTPIYWLFDSGKNNGFKALIYMHRYTPDLVARVRTDYLHKTQKAIELAIENCDSVINNSSNNKEIANANKDKNKLLKQLEETIQYDEALAHIANQQISIDLDDGVKVNYSKFQDVEITLGSGKVKKVNLLKKI
ncbi:MAG: restriction endonuclease subunit M, partial [Methanobrevibacter sp.]|nr:restriction endonuclease subunit M [Methanobrevibacter sp.]